jgi:5'-phosphate synthase pdxT subunit
MASEKIHVVGILALQGAFIEHRSALESLPYRSKLEISLVKTLEDLSRCDALIIPGGESTTIALLARISGLLDALRVFAKQKPVWGTCAGAIFLSQNVENAKKGGQELLHAMSVTIARNGWGSQLESFEAPLNVTGLMNAEEPFNGVFIRAPVLLSLHPSPEDPPIQVVAKLSSKLLPPSLASPNHADEPKTFVAIRQGLHFLTTFHPELTDDNRFHDYFIRECVFRDR